MTIRCHLCGLDTAQHRWPGGKGDQLVCDRCWDALWDDYGAYPHD